MCGILGIFNYSKANGIVDPDVLSRMTDVIHHRGPDDGGTYISDDGRVAFGFRRLSIIDLSDAGHQPMSNADGSIWIVFNGEVYNHLEIRKDLEAKGYRYTSKTDTETILYAYQEYGLDFVHKLYGMFGIAIWDASKEQLIVIRDRLGVKPIYYSQRDGAFFFASEMKSLHEHPSFTREVHPQALYDYLSFYMTPPNQTLFDGIKKLEPGHILIVDKHGEVRKEEYWDITHDTEGLPSEGFKDESFCIENIHRLLRDSIKLRMVADVPFGVLLSGGVDSSLNVALMAEQMDRPVETFSVGFKDLEKYNEMEYAQQIAREFGTNHHEALINEDDVIDFLPKMVWHQDEPNADPACVPMFFVAKLARDSGTVVVQVGEGADEEFSGYSHYLQELQYHKYYYNLLPNVVQKMLYPVFKAWRPHSPLSEYARRASTRETPFFFGAMPGFSEEVKPLLLSEEFYNQSESTSRISLRYFEELRSRLNGVQRDHLHQMTYFDIKNRLGEMLLMRVDKMAMASSIEARVPFLDHRMVEFAYRVPTELKVKNKIGKYILKKAAEGILPTNVIYRPKKGLNSPISEWLRTKELSRYAREAILDSPLINSGTFNVDFIRQLFEKHSDATGSKSYSKQIWVLLTLSLWYEQYFSNR